MQFGKFEVHYETEHLHVGDHAAATPHRKD
jgi:hypothetical protein